MELQRGQQAPGFELPDENGEIKKLSDYKGKWVLVYFYPKDDTPGCTIEACGLRDNLPKFENINAVVLGISADSAQSHKDFKSNHNLTFTLLADEQKQAIAAYGAGGGFMGGAKRKSFLINPNGEIAKIYKDVNPEKHAEEVLADLAEMSK